jgi:type I restriction enzyme, S subunit
MTRSVRKGWVPRKLNELGFVGRGKSRHRPRNAPELYGGPYPLVQTADIMASEFFITSYSKTYSEAGLAQSKMWQPNTLCMTIAGENTAETAILTFPACFPDSVVGFVADQAIADVRFVKYYLDHIKRQIRQITRGATQDNLSLDKLLSFDIVSPPVAQQTKIASVASSYDTLILNNARRIAILEEMAQAQYREWFVHFRFPGHENVPLISSPLGDIPQGWGKSLGDVLTLKRGYDLPHSQRQPGAIPIVSSSGITDFHSKAKVKGPGVVTGRYGTLGEVFYVAGDFWPLNTSLYVQNFRGNSPLITVHLLKSLNLARQNAAGAVPGVNRNALHMLPVAFPPASLQKQIEPTFFDLHLGIENLRKRIDVLRQTRDLLLPKLISGQLDVENLDIDVGELVTA